MGEYVKFERRESVALITIDRASALNALSLAILAELDDVFAQAAADPSVAAIVLTGAGEKAFVAGADIKEMSNLDEPGGRAHAQHGQAVLGRIAGSGKPVIAAIGGFALGGGLELAMACHIRYASDNARFGQPEVKLGLIPGFGGTQRLARLIGTGRALELLLDGGKMLRADEALALGLINAIHPREKLVDECVALGLRIAKMGPVACRFVLEAVAYGIDRGQASGLAREAELFGKCFATADGKEGMAAFLEKRAARFQGK